MKSDKEKGEEILKRRDDARKGIERVDPKGRDPMQPEAESQDKAGELAGIAIGAGLKRSG